MMSLSSTSLLFVSLSLTTTVYGLTDCIDDVYHQCFGIEGDTSTGKYKGEFENGKKHGQGTLIFLNGDSYEGQFSNGLEHGKGVFKFANGDMHVGKYSNGEANGKGIYTFTNGDIHSGLFCAGEYLHEISVAEQHSKLHEFKYGW
ncbi:MAG: hypothetical protein ACJA2R_000365 [Saprospiraceae bacterium]|jgi:hypothetical protein